MQNISIYFKNMFFLTKIFYYNYFMMQNKLKNTYLTFCKKSDFYQCVLQLIKASLRIKKKSILYLIN